MNGTEGPTGPAWPDYLERVLGAADDSPAQETPPRKDDAPRPAGGPPPCGAARPGDRMDPP